MRATLILSLVAATSAQAQHFDRNKGSYDDLDFERIQTEHFNV